MASKRDFVPLMAHGWHLRLCMLLLFICRLGPATGIVTGGWGTTFIVASFPEFKQVNYATTQEPIWRPLIAAGLLFPDTLCIDADNKRLYVADQSAGMVYWYQISTPGGRLVTDGQQHVAVRNVLARGLAVDNMGNLYVAGRSLAEPPLVPVDAIFKLNSISIATALSSGIEVPPTLIWTRNNTKIGGESPQIYQPSGLAITPFNIFWGNAVRGQGTGTLVKAPLQPSPTSTQGSLSPLADNDDAVTSVVLTPRDVFFCAKGGVYGVPQTKIGADCGEGSSLCPLVAKTPGATAMAWDGDGTIFVADRAQGKVMSFPSGSIAQEKPVEPVAAAEGIWGLALLADIASPSACNGRHHLLLAFFAVALLIPLRW